MTGSNFIVVLCERGDLPGLWAARGLERRGAQVEVITPALLCRALEWEHRLEGERTVVSVGLHDGRRLSGDGAVGVLNRLTAVPADALGPVGDADRDYALQELHALILSCLYALPGPVVNRPTPQGLCGSWRHPSQWTALAHEAGLAAPAYRQSSSDPPYRALARPADATGAVVFVVGDRVLPTRAGMPSTVLAGCLRLAGLAGETLLGVELIAPAGRWALAGASVVPDLSLGGEDLLDALEAVLQA